MKIGFDISQTGANRAGCGYFADSLIQSLAGMNDKNEYILYPHFGVSFWDPEGENKTRNMDNCCHVSRILIGKNFHEVKTFWEHFPPDGETMIGSPDIVHANNFFCPRGFKKVRTVYTLHDLSFLIYPDFTSEENRWNCFQGVFNASCYADFIVAISQYSRDSFLETFPHYPVDRIRVVHPGSRFSSVTEYNRESVIAGLVPGKFWLVVGTLEPRKNVRRLLSAYSVFISRHEESIPLVLAGGKGWLEDDLGDFICGLGIRDRVRMLGYVEDDELMWLYKNCLAFLYPSLFEGFGLPVLEALSLGAAVITSNTTSLPEVADYAACYVDPLKEGDMVAAMSRLISDEDYRMKLKNLARQQALKFSWERCASQILDIYREVMNKPRRENLY